MTERELPARFDPAVVERRWQEAWEKAQLFRAPDTDRGSRFSLALPPPNVTGVLTLGHMLGDSVMDVLVRSHRMRGERTLWLPGVDHAGLSTQVEVRRKLLKQGVRLEEMPREEALQAIETWKREHETVIVEQIRRGGFSVDWSRYRYTFDEPMKRVTTHVFVQLYNEGLIYRGERIVNWDPRLRSALSDLEVIHTEETTELLTILYAWADGRPGGISVATVRPETIFGDVAVAVHPDDARHAEAVGRSVRVPLTDRVVPVITDPGIDPTFGTGALKVTPRHDLLDFEIQKRHPALPLPPSVLDETGHLEGEWVPPAFRGLDRDKARAAVRDALKTAGLLQKIEPHLHSVGRSERSDAVIEPRLSTQWFVKVAPLAERAVEAVRRGDVKFHPERWTPSFFRWMEKLEDWCISRQVFWGHRIPVYTCGSCQAVVASLEAPAQCASCGKGPMNQESDVLDTWFTSWLWPFASLGWPDPTSDFARYYPTQVLVTGRDIMFFWVARMIMAGYHFTDRAPFSDVYYTGMLRDDQGRRMSKHLGNSPDPLQVIGEVGADALRFALLYPNPADQDGPFGRASLEGARHFLTKLWNVVRFTASHLPPGTEPPGARLATTSSTRLEERWIASRYASTVEEVDAALAGFELTRAATLLHAFLWHDLADRYIEVVKATLAGEHGEEAAREARATLGFVVERTLRLLHPFAPHVTEELWQGLPHSGEFLAVAPWPHADEAPRDRAAEAEMDAVFESIRVFRNLRAENHLAPAEPLRGWARVSTPEAAKALHEHGATVAQQARLAELVVLAPGAPSPPEVATSVIAIGEYFLALPKERSATEFEALRRERSKLNDLLTKTRARLGDEGFRSRAPPEVVREQETKVAELTERLRRIDGHLGGATAEGAA
ncbi:MAG: valine--tRNA ligase [Thermoplasmata archaeon]|nr:valine--tRNA ligase [Thermoplasmata archaeon]